MTKRIAIAKSIEHAANLNIINNVDKMTTQEIETQINLQEIHNARTKRTVNNLGNNEKLLARYGGMYTQTEINLLHDLHPYLAGCNNTFSTAEPEILNEKEIVKLLD